MFTQVVIAEKVTGIYKLAAVKRVWNDGRIQFGKATAKKGNGWEQIGWGFDEGQVTKFVKNSYDNGNGILLSCN